MAATANAGDDIITLDGKLDWAAGSKIVIASTGFDHNESEVHNIKSLTWSDDKS